MKSRGARSCLYAAGLGFLCLLGTPATSHAQQIDDLCIVRIKGSDPGPGEGGSAHRLALNVRSLPGVAWPIVFRHAISPSAWRIDSARELVPMAGDWPRNFGSLFLRFAAGDRPGKVIGVADLSVHVLDPGQLEFRQIATYERGERKFYLDVIRVDRINATIVGGTEGLFVVDGDKLRPLDDVTKRPTSMNRLTDLPKFGGFAWASSGSIFIRWDSGLFEQIRTSATALFRIEELENPDLLVLQFHSGTEVLPVSGAPGERRISAIRSSPWPPSNRMGFASKVFDAYLLGPDNNAAGPLQRLGRNGLEPVPGPVISKARLHDLTAVGLVLVQAAEGFFVYDGKVLSRLDVGAELADKSYGLDMPSIGRAFLKVPDSLLQITRDKRVERVALPADLDIAGARFADMPARKAALALAERGVFAIGADLTIRRVSGGENVVRGLVAHPDSTIPIRNELMLADRTGMYVVTDKRALGAHACP